MAAPSRAVRTAALGLLVAGAAGASPRADATRLDRVAWMAGCWRAESEGRVYEEQWMAPRGTVMPGMSRSTRGARTVGWEHLLIRVDEDGALIYGAHPSGQEPVEFRSAEVGADSVVFANPAHDFPQRIAYHRAAGGDSLIARVGTLPRDGQGARSIDFAMARVTCPGGEGSP